MARIVGVDLPKLGEGVMVFGKAIAAAKKKYRWSVELPIRIHGMLLAGKTLFLGGLADVLDKKEPWAAFDGKKGGLLWAISTADGKILSKQKLDSPPYFDGMAAAGGKLYISTQDGKLLCLGKE